MEKEDLGWMRLRFGKCKGREGESGLSEELSREVPERMVMV